MEDKTILDLYVQRSERAIAETAAKYGAYCGAVADNILACPEDVEEILNDTWLAAWRDIPPSQPVCLRAYLGRITRNLALSRFRFYRTKKRYAGLETLLSELEDCIPAPGTPETELERRELSRLISSWLGGLEPEQRRLFVRRYWHGVPVRRLAREAGIGQNAMAQRLARLRQSLKARLEQEGAEL
ncbi:MAG: sigma-70 family RNA polymerase sigma factor [Oscillospiraceae bacterium]|nr:sigma-70 family RNA polymerase sigma factor [Oscillospiraceae bacterium]MBR7010376.1 sigma-70 family RNA polymerase sigma factor [Oscillospiraceae bacterium]